MQVSSFTKGFELDTVPTLIRPIDHQIPSAPPEPRKGQVQNRPHVQQDEVKKEKEKEKDKEARSVLDSRLRRQEMQCYSPATAAIVSAAQGLDESSLVIVADLITFVCRAEGGRAGRQRRCAVADTPKTLDHISNWLSMQNELLGNDLLAGLMAPPQCRRSSSCPPKKNPYEGLLLKGDRVVALKDIKSKKNVIVVSGTHGTVNSSCDSKVNISFDERVDNVKKAVNVKYEVIEKATPAQDAAYLNDRMLAAYDNKLDNEEDNEEGN